MGSKLSAECGKSTPNRQEHLLDDYARSPEVKRALQYQMAAWYVENPGGKIDKSLFHQLFERALASVR